DRNSRDQGGTARVRLRSRVLPQLTRCQDLAQRDPGECRFPAGYEDEADIDQRRQCMSGPTGRRTVKTDPLPGLLVTVTSPHHARELARPGPVPPNARSATKMDWLGGKEAPAAQ